MRVFHPEGFEFEITMNNLSFILANSDISAQEIMIPCVLGWFRGSIYLVPSHTAEGQEIIKNNNKEKNLSSLEVGETIKIKNKELIYLGLRKYGKEEKPTFFSITDKNYPSFTKIPDYETLNKKVNIDEYLEQLKQITKINKNKKTKNTDYQSILKHVYHTFTNNAKNMKTAKDELEYFIKLMKSISSLSRNFYFCEEELYKFNSKDQIQTALHLDKTNFIKFFGYLFSRYPVTFFFIEVNNKIIFVNQNTIAEKVKYIYDYLNNDFSNLSQEKENLRFIISR